jgi:hypothetical protein
MVLVHPEIIAQNPTESIPSTTSISASWHVDCIWTVGLEAKQSSTTVVDVSKQTYEVSTAWLRQIYNAPPYKWRRKDRCRRFGGYLPIS